MPLPTVAVQTEPDPAALIDGIVAFGGRWTAAGTSIFRPFGLNFMEVRIVYLLGRVPGLRASAIADRISVHPAAISRALKVLRQRDLVAIDAKWRLTLTDQGGTLWPDIAQTFDGRIRHLIDGLDMQDIRLMHDFVQRLHRSLASAGNSLQLLNDQDAGGLQQPRYQTRPMKIASDALDS